MDLGTGLDWAKTRRNAVLITLRADGRPQSSDVAYVLDGRTFLVSVTHDRAKTHNMRRDPRIVLHITDPSAWTYLSFDGTAELSPVTTSTGDETNDRLVAYFRAVRGEEHPDWDEYRRAMVDQGRLLVAFTPTTVVGQINA
jgi:PPOX class probable F420-dependent enzyme